jgi:ribosomal protein S18 acetylase RimI-like enzyme
MYYSLNGNKLFPRSLLGGPLLNLAVEVTVKSCIVEMFQKLEHLDALPTDMVFLTVFVSGFDKQKDRQDILCFVASKQELMQDQGLFMRFLRDEYHRCNESNKSTLNLLNELKKHWKVDARGYLAACQLTVNLAPTPGIHLSDIGVAPCLRRQGVMKKVLLSNLQKVAKAYPSYADKFQLTAFPIHIAVWKLFNPKAAVSSFYPGMLEEVSLSALLKDRLYQADVSSSVQVVVPQGIFKLLEAMQKDKSEAKGEDEMFALCSGR